MPDRLHVLLDQNVPRAVRDWLRAQRPGWTVVHTSDVGLTGKKDPEVFAWAQSAGAVVVSFDEDFADRRSFPAGRHHGVVRLRVWPTTIEETQSALARLLAEVSEDEIPGSLVIIGRHRIRVRRSP